jgi:hypothetical protein
MTYSELLTLDKQIPTISQGLTKLTLSKTAQPKREANSESTVDTTTPRNLDSKLPSDHHTRTPSTHAAKGPADQIAIVSGNHATTTRDLVRRIRQAVHRIGKEAATYRFTRDEKVGLMEIVYQQGKLGIRTSENEIVRVAVNWLLQNHRIQGEGSMLSLVLEALRA